jgi:primosomal protein N'
MQRWEGIARHAANGPGSRVLALAWNTGDGKKTIFYDGVTWLRTDKVLIPGVATLARLVARVRDEATDRLHDMLRGVLSPRQRARG